MYLSGNLEALKSRPENLHLLNTLPSNTDDLTLMPTQAGDYTLLYQNIPLHATSGAEIEAIQACEQSIHPAKENTHVLVGLGLGYCLDAILAHSEGTVVVYEPFESILRFTLENADLSAQFATGRVIVTDRMEVLRYLIPRVIHLNGTVDGLVLPGYQAIMGKTQIDAVFEAITDLVNEQGIYLHSGFSLNPEWNLQFLDNLPRFVGSQPFGALQGRFTGKPALILCSGPSLDPVLPQIKDIADKVITLATPGAVAPLLQTGVTPDFVVFVDFEGPKKQLSQVPRGQTQGSAFLLGPFSDEYCFEIPAKERFWLSFNNYQGLQSWMTQDLAQPNVGFSSGSSVSVAAYQCAQLMGCDPLILVGQNLAFAGTQQYAGGIHVELHEDGFVLPDSEVQYGRSLRLTKVKGWQGETLNSSPDYRLFLQQFEALAVINQGQNRLINCSEGGAWIKGFEHLPLVQLVDELGLKKSPPLDKTYDLPELPSRREQLENVSERLKSTQSIAQEALQTTRSAIDALKLLPKLPRHQWEGQLINISTQQQALFALLKPHPFLYGFLGEPLWRWSHEADPTPDLDFNYLVEIHGILAGKVLPQLEKALRHSKAIR